MIRSKPWNWRIDVHDSWRHVADEFLPVASRWKDAGLHRALDLGCGIGRNAIYMAMNGFDVHAFDLSESGLQKLTEEARKLELNIQTRLGDMIDLPYEDCFFDCLLAFHSIYHTDYEGLVRVVSEIKRVVRRDGEIFLTLNSKENDAWTSDSSRKIDGFTLLKDETTESDVPHTYLSYEEVLDLLSDLSLGKVQQVFDYSGGRKHAHFYISCTNR